MSLHQFMWSFILDLKLNQHFTYVTKTAHVFLFLVQHSQVGSNGYFTFDGFTGYSPFTFNEITTKSLVAPFFTDLDIRDVGQINYEVHNETTSQSLLSRVNSLINHHAQTEFNGEWMLVATWDGVKHYGINNVSLTHSHT